MKTLNIKQMLLTANLTETGSLTQTAKALHLSQPAVSHQLKALEEGLGVPIFERQGKRLIATPAGKALAERSQKILVEIENAVHETRNLAKGQSGNIKIAVECYTCYNWLPKIITKFRATYPDIEIEFCPNATVDIHSKIVRGDIDLGIVTSTPPAQDIHYQDLFTDNIVIVLTHNHPLANEGALTLDQLIDDTWIFYSETKEKHNEVFFFPNGQPTPEKVIELQLTEAIIEWVKNGLGITIMAQWAAHPYLSGSPQLKCIPLNLETDTNTCRNWFIATRYKNMPEPWQFFSQLIRDNPPNNLCSEST